MQITIKKEDFEKIYQHAVKERPDEACGLIAGTDREDGVREIKKVYLLTNIDHTNEHFSIDPKEQLAAIKESPSRPSEEDKRLANDSKASYLIISLAEEQPVLNAFHVETVDGEKVVRKEELIIL